MFNRKKQRCLLLLIYVLPSAGQTQQKLLTYCRCLGTGTNVQLYLATLVNLFSAPKKHSHTGIMLTDISLYPETIDFYMFYY